MSTKKLWEKHFGNAASVPFGDNVVGFFDEITKECENEPPKMNTFSEIDLIRMSDFEFLATIRAWPMESKWSDKKAFAHGLLRLTHMNGARYTQTGKITAFTKSIR